MNVEGENIFLLNLNIRVFSVYTIFFSWLKFAAGIRLISTRPSFNRADKTRTVIQRVNIFRINIQDVDWVPAHTDNRQRAHTRLLSEPQTYIKETFDAIRPNWLLARRPLHHPSKPKASVHLMLEYFGEKTS